MPRPLESPLRGTAMCHPVAEVTSGGQNWLLIPRQVSHQLALRLLPSFAGLASASVSRRGEQGQCLVRGPAHDRHAPCPGSSSVLASSRRKLGEVPLPAPGWPIQPGQSQWASPALAQPQPLSLPPPCPAPGEPGRPDSHPTARLSMAPPAPGQWLSELQSCFISAVKPWGVQCTWIGWIQGTGVGAGQKPASSLHGCTWGWPCRIKPQRVGSWVSHREPALCKERQNQVLRDVRCG